MAADPLGRLVEAERCPTCAAIHQQDLPRCPECGTFHVTQAFVDVAPPSAAQRAKAEAPRPAVDISAYSYDPDGSIPDEHFEEDEVTKEWTSAGTDFAFDEDDAPVARIAGDGAAVFDDDEAVFDDEDEDEATQDEPADA